MTDKKVVTELTIVCPWYVEIPRKTKANKKYTLNLNVYRNLDFRVNNTLKQLFKEQMRSQMEGIELVTPFEVEVQIYKPTRRKLDKSNVFSVTSKFTYDALSEWGVIEDDNDEYIGKEVILPTIHDKGNGRIEFRFKSLENGIHKES